MKTKAILLLFSILIMFVSLTAGTCETTEYPTGNIHGWIFDASSTDSNSTAAILGGVTVTITYEGGMAEDTIVGPYTTTSSYIDGTFDFTAVEAGTYTIAVTAPVGKIGIDDESIRLEANETLNLAPFALPDEVETNTIRAVLTWASDTDLDLHVTYPISNYGKGASRDMVYWNNTESSILSGTEPIVELEKDILGSETNGPGYGPETAHFIFDSNALAGWYAINVYAFGDASATESTDADLIGLSNATVRFCDNTGCWLNYVVAENTLGNLWHVAYFYWDSSWMDDGSPYIYGYDMEYLVDPTDGTVVEDTDPDYDSYFSLLEAK